MKNVPRRWVCVALSSCGLAGAAGSAWAQTSPYYLGVSQAFTQESNVFRVAEGLPETKDTISTTSLLAGINQPFGRQRFFLDGAARYNRYDDNDQLDHTGYALDVGLDWETVESLSGRLGYTVKENLARYGADLGPTITSQNLERSQEIVARGQYGLVSLLSIEGSVVHRQLDYSSTAFAFQEFKQDAVRLGLLYRPSGLITLGVAGRHTKGEYPFALEPAPGVFQADEFTRDDVDLTALWVPTGQSTVRARISYTKEEHETVATRDVSQSTGSLAWDYKPTAKLAFTTEVIRDTGAETAFTGLTQAGAASVGNNSLLSTTVALRVGYEVTAKVQLDLGGRYVERDLVNTQGGALPATGSDRLSEVKLGLTWIPTRSLLFGCSVSHEKRSTNSTLSYAYSANVATCLGQFKI